MEEIFRCYRGLGFQRLVVRTKRNCNKIKKEKMKIGTKLVKKRKLFKKKIDVELSCHLSIDVATKILPHQYII